MPLTSARERDMHAAKDLSIGLALSGGGFRATLFGLGSLWRLNEAGLIGRLARVTGVSGGSILAGILAFHWRQLRFVDGRADNFEAVVAPPVREFCGQSIDIKTAALGHLVPFMTSAASATSGWSAAPGGCRSACRRTAT